MVKLRHKIDISIRDFIRSGKFDVLAPGQSKAWILDNFPDPDDYGGGRGKRREDAAIWRYGNLELHFEGDLLWMIYTDYIERLDGGPSLVLDRWILSEGEAPTLDRVARELNLDGVDYLVRNQVWEGRSSIQASESGVCLDFDAVEERYRDPGEFVLVAISLSSNLSDP